MGVAVIIVYSVFAVSVCLVYGVFGDEVKSVMGESVTLNTGVTKQQRDKMLWYFNNTLIALINGEASKSCLYDGEGGIFSGRLDVDYKSGSLTITCIGSEHTGRYEAHFIQSESSGTSQSLNRNSKCDGTKVIPKMSNIGDSIKTFSVSVSGVFGDEVKSVMGESVPLNTGVTKQQRDKMLWYFHNTRIALINGEASKSCLYDGEGGIFRDRLDVDYKSGSLTITDVRPEHTGRYEAHFIRSESSGTSQSLNRNSKCDGTKVIPKICNIGDSIKTFSVSVSAALSVPEKTIEDLNNEEEWDWSLSSGLIAGVVAAVVLLVFVSVAGVIYYLHKRSKNANMEKNKLEHPLKV